MKIHLDLDSFFVSAHRVFDKSLLNKPVVVVKRNDKEIFENHKSEVLNLNRGAFTGDLIVSKKEYDKSYFLENGKIRGIVVTSSYEARELGIKTGTTLKEALEIYPKLTVLLPDYKLYHTLSYKLKEFLKVKIPFVEQFSIDEFFGDLEGWVDDRDAFLFCKDLKDEIWEKFSLPISIGIAKSKWTAKLATSFAKPNGVFMVEEVDEFIKDIPIEKFPGIGRRIEKRLKERGILTLGDVKENREYFYSWGKPGVELYKRVCGIDNEEVKEREVRKSIGISRRFDVVYDRRELVRRVHVLCRYLSFLVLKYKLNPTFYYLKIKYKDKTSSKAHVRIHRLFNELLLKEIMTTLFYRADEKEMGVISLSLAVSKFKRESNLFDYEKDLKLQNLNEAIFKIRSKFGVSALMSAEEIHP
ncbi:DNA polymerase Y family protein [Caminibacter pacificus]|uniref:DNA polymerase IV n=1 Tax=Caminibacter pacificus TaxID=1424653 RepID=A0AAJ4REI2_9BACT|nr:DNA polymerase IV [Caminibacter pacificus]QCI28171.1 DNA polymerase IV [Caminibacter pacificus]ROR41116.1 DNA polymerase-4 [Caminibacter pacificus]